MTEEKPEEFVQLELPFDEELPSAAVYEALKRQGVTKGEKWEEEK